MFMRKKRRKRRILFLFSLKTLLMMILTPAASLIPFSRVNLLSQLFAGNLKLYSSRKREKVTMLVKVPPEIVVLIMSSLFPTKKVKDAHQTLLYFTSFHLTFQDTAQCLVEQ
ncbi:hypothetical protein OIU79_020144 [Salix purpurea]|uniref:Uncharacterized protein n=1 Tax=Salix purpurea TaxID=77065 RepID=A0A9Q0SKN4_SALPP|nr:hypothetical protein OIU79_020144 [Salix purpurea]